MKRLQWLAMAVGWGLAFAGCGDDDDPTATRDAGGGERDARPVDEDARVSASDGGREDGGGEPGGTLAERYPGDEGIGSDPSVLFHDDFEGGWGQWDAPTDDTMYLHLENGALANAGSSYLRSTVTRDHLEADQYISASPRYVFDRRVDTVYWRFHVRFPNVAPNPHHWVRVAAGTESWSSSGLANTVPPGDEGFWFDFDISNDDVFNFYVYWHQMRSGRCNDGSATPGCEGDQGTTYYYGNVFSPNDQTAYPRDEWFCVEMRGEASTPGTSDGSLAFWIDDVPVGDYGPGRPDGTWLRATFHEDGCEFSACTDPAPFEGFDFRTDSDVRFKAIFLDAYYERDSTDRKIETLEGRGLTVSREMTILYDDVVVATERIGCRTGG
ncbi:MAG: hypothetical protein JJ863_06350 [Deltaproteobacteria bacterium]|nr:hypothetical protein [Deltaproteobacteria bacterium]